MQYNCRAAHLRHALLVVLHRQVGDTIRVHHLRVAKHG
jgi:hypothetical protein